MEEKKYAVLIDGDNVSYNYVDVVLKEMTKYGNLTIKRVYSDFTTNMASGWKKTISSKGIRAIQSFANTKGKNATDSTLIIDAMDILYTGDVDGFCIVSSDSDFTSIAIRLNEAGMHVIGMGESKTPESFRGACTLFRNLEILKKDYEDGDSELFDNNSQTKKTDSKDADSKENVHKSNEKKASDIAKKADKTGKDIETKLLLEEKKSERSMSEIENEVISIINENISNGRRTTLGEVGNRLLKLYNDFDVRQYGYSSLSTFVANLGHVDLIKEDNVFYVDLLEDDYKKFNVIDYALEQIRDFGDSSGIDLSVLGQHIHDKYPDFKVKEYGYSTLQKFLTNSGVFCFKTSSTGSIKVKLKKKN